MECEKSVIREIKKVSNIIKRNIEEIINKDFDFKTTSTHELITRYLHENKGKDVFQKDIEKEFDIRRSTVTVTLNLMEKNGIIKRETVDYDARLKKISLTNKAIEMHQAIFCEIQKIEKDMLTGLSNKEIDDFYKTLNKIKANIKNASKK